MAKIPELVWPDRLGAARADDELPTRSGRLANSAGIVKPARSYDLRSTFISNALATGLTVFETARIAGTSVKMIEAHYGALLDTAHESMLERLEAQGGAR